MTIFCDHNTDIRSKNLESLDVKLLFFVFSEHADSGSVALSPAATVLETLCKSCHIVYLQRPSPSLCGNLKLNTTQGQPLLNALLCSQKKAKVAIGVRRGAS